MNEGTANGSGKQQQEKSSSVWRASLMFQLIGMIQITRPKVGLVAVLYTLLGAYLGGKINDLLSPDILRTALVVGLIVSFSFSINDYRDAISDSLNHPERPIPSGRLPRHRAGILSLALALSAIGIALTLDPVLIAIALTNVILSTLYSYFLKKIVLVGNITIGLLNASIVIYGSLAVHHLIPAVWIVSLLTFLYSLAQEILFAVGDREGDILVGEFTTATYLGTTNAVRLFQIVALSFVVVTIVVWFLGLAPNWFLYAMLPCSILPLLGIVAWLGGKVTNRKIHLAIRMIKFVRFFSLVPGVLLK